MKMKILVVDDDEWSLPMMRIMLKAERHEVYTARNGCLVISDILSAAKGLC